MVFHLEKIIQCALIRQCELRDDLLSEGIDCGQEHRAIVNIVGGLDLVLEVLRLSAEILRQPK